jgi:hypothetical protein
MNEALPEANKNSQDDLQTEINKVIDEVGLEIEELRLEFKARAEAGAVTPSDRESFQARLALLYTQYVSLSRLQ